jgi:DNA phosphorothioation-dependent restriction protein DptF
MAALSAFDLLAKSSPASVSTQGSSSEAERSLKEYLYVKDAVHDSLTRTLRERATVQRSVVFLCGTSGDGKSELIRRVRPEFEAAYRFHVDATHSFRPDGTALDALEELFSSDAPKPILVGVNLGMLANFANHSPSTHKDLKGEIQEFFAKRPPGQRARFVDFNDFPKFSSDEQGTLASRFLLELVQRVTLRVPENPIYEALKLDEQQLTQRWKNFRLLGVPVIQRRLIHVLALCHLRNGLFLPTRMLLDTLHQLIAADGYFFDALFASQDSELLRAAASLDPAARRSTETDRFLLSNESNTPEALAFAEGLRAEVGFSLDDVAPRGWLRLYYLLHGEQVGSNYHQRFATLRLGRVTRLAIGRVSAASARKRCARRCWPSPIGPIHALERTGSTSVDEGGASFQRRSTSKRRLPTPARRTSHAT